VLELVVEGKEYYDEDKEEFVYPESFTLKLEHSLLSLSKWEQKYEKPFIDKVDKTPEEVVDYIEMMILNEDYPPDILNRLTDEHAQQIMAYTDAKMTATTFRESVQGRNSGEYITNELIYYWIFALEMPIEVESWHLNRLFTQIKVMNTKQQKPKRMSPTNAAAERRRLNAQRKAELNSAG
jgi:hypothetical protein